MKWKAKNRFVPQEQNCTLAISSCGVLAVRTKAPSKTIVWSPSNDLRSLECGHAMLVNQKLISPDNGSYAVLSPDGNLQLLSAAAGSLSAAAPVTDCKDDGAASTSSSASGSSSTAARLRWQSGSRGMGSGPFHVTLSCQTGALEVLDGQSALIWSSSPVLSPPASSSSSSSSSSSAPKHKVVAVVDDGGAVVVQNRDTSPTSKVWSSAGPAQLLPDQCLPDGGTQISSPDKRSWFQVDAAGRLVVVSADHGTVWQTSMKEKTAEFKRCRVQAGGSHGGRRFSAPKR